MLNTTRHDPQSIGEILAGKLERAKLRRSTRRRPHPRPRAKRPKRMKRPSSPPPDPRATHAERALQRTELGRQTLRLADDLSLAKAAEGAAQYALATAEATERQLRQRLCALAPMHTAEQYASAEEIQRDLLNAEADVRHWKGEHQRLQAEVGRLEAELGMLAGYL